jgi:multidrug efflux pump subunit AcrB
VSEGPIGWMARNSVAANLLAGVLVVGGLFSLSTIPQKEFPDIDIPIITVGVAYRGAAPEESESGVCVRIEEAVLGVEGIEQVRSTATEGACVVSIELLTDADPARALDDVKSRVDALDTLPAETEKPVIQRLTPRRPVVDVAIAGDTDERSLKQLAERTRDEISRLPGITQVEIAGARPYEISIEVSEASLRRFGLSFDEVAGAVRRASLDLPGGTIETAGGEILLRTQGQAYRGHEFEELVVRTRPDGTRVRVRDVARVVDGFEDTDQSTVFDGQPAVIVQVFRVGDQDVLEISSAVKAWVAAAQRRMPEGVQIEVWKDGSTPLRDRIDTMIRNGLSGLLVVVTILALFMRPRLALWVAAGVPIAMLGTFFVMPALGINIDVISLFAFILVLGILVDDATVVGENTYTRMRRGQEPLDAAIEGTREVAVPVIFGVLTTVAAFMPLRLVEGQMGQIFGVMAAVVICCLLFSLVESQLVLPSHLAHAGYSTRTARTAWGRRWDAFQERVARGFEDWVDGPYRRLLVRTIEWRYATVAAGVALLLLTFGVMASGRLKFTFFPEIQADYITAQLAMPQGTPVDVTARAVAQIEQAALALRGELDAELAPKSGSALKHILAAVGAQPSLDQTRQAPGSSGAGAGGGSHLGEVTLELLEAKQRGIPAKEVARRWRELTGPVPEAEELAFSSSLFSAGSPVNVQLAGDDVAQLEQASGRIRTELARVPGVFDVSDSFRAGKAEVKLSILPAGEALGLSLSDLARQVRQAFYGEEAQRIQRGRDDVRVMVRYPESERRSLGDLENLRIRSAEGAEVPFRTVAKAELGRGYATIRRTDRQRVINVTADVDATRVSADQVLAELGANVLPKVLRDYPGMTYSFEGSQRTQRQALGSLLRWFGVALFVIYALLAVPLRSYGQPLVIMSVIPFGLVGAIVGHLVMRAVKGPSFGLSFLSITGIVALTGVVVNASLIMVHHVNARRADGSAMRAAVVDAAVSRFRPIFLTSVTTFGGLTPLLLETSVQAQFLVPMATSLGFGVIFASAITLLLLPSGYVIFEDLRGLPAWLTARGPRPSRANAPAPPPSADAPAIGGGGS